MFGGKATGEERPLAQFALVAQDRNGAGQLLGAAGIQGMQVGALLTHGQRLLSFRGQSTRAVERDVAFLCSV